MIRIKELKTEDPSINAASSSSFGMDPKYGVTIQTISGRDTNRFAIISEVYVPVIFSFEKIMYHGTRNVIAGIIRTARIMSYSLFCLYLAISYAAGKPNRQARTVAPVLTIKLFIIGFKKLYFVNTSI